MNNDAYQPVPHDAVFREQLLSDPAVKEAFDANVPKYAILDEILKARHEPGSPYKSMQVVIFIDF